MAIKIGYNYNGGWYTQAQPIASQLSCALVINNMALAKSLVQSNKIIIHRYTDLNGVKDEGFGEWHKSIGALAYADELIKAHGAQNKDVWMIAFNEPNVGTLEDMVFFIGYAIQVFNRLRLAGFKVVGINTPLASIPADWVNAGAYDPMIDYAHAYRYVFIWGYHDYSDFALVRFGANDEKDYSRLDDRGYVAPANWSKVINPATSWHLFHITRVIQRARDMGKRPRFGATELGYSEVEDSNTEAQVNRLNSIFPASPVGGVLNGQHTLHAYWRAMYPDWSWEQVVMEQLKWYSARAWVEIEFGMLYGFAFGGEHGQDFWNDGAFHAMLINWQKEVIVTPPVIPPPIGGKSVYLTSTGSSTNIRKGASTATAIIGAVTVDTPAILMETANGWHEILWDGRIGYVSAQFVIVRDAPSQARVFMSSTGTATRIRVQPSTSSGIIGNITQRTPVVLLGRVGDWYKILWDGQVGYTYAQYIVIEDR